MSERISESAESKKPEYFGDLLKKAYSVYILAMFEYRGLDLTEEDRLRLDQRSQAAMNRQGVKNNAELRIGAPRRDGTVYGHAKLYMTTKNWELDQPKIEETKFFVAPNGMDEYSVDGKLVKDDKEYRPWVEFVAEKFKGEGIPFYNRYAEEEA